MSPLYSTLRRARPFTSTQVCVEGHEMQGDGCLPRNLTSLVRHIMALPSIDVVVDFFLQAIKKRRDSRRNLFHSNRFRSVQVGRRVGVVSQWGSPFCL